MKRTYGDYVADILTCFQETQDFIRGMDFNTFAADRKTINARNYHRSSRSLRRCGRTCRSDKHAAQLPPLGE